MLLYKYFGRNDFEPVARKNLLWFSSLEKANNKRERYSNVSNYLNVSSEKFLCMSCDYANLAMWYHYANRSDGLCVEFSFPEDAFSCVCIEYLNPRIKAEAQRLSNYDMSARDYLSKKSWEWRYEDEVRVFCNVNDYKDLFQLKDERNDEEGVLDIGNYTQRIFLGDSFNYAEVQLDAARFLYEKYQYQLLKVLTKQHGYVESVLDCLSPELIKLFKNMVSMVKKME